MNDSEIAASLAKAIVSDRGLGQGVADSLAADYLAWRGKLEKREVAEWEDRKAKRYVDRTWLFEGRPSVVFAGQGKGKSNFAAWVIEKALETRPGWDIYTNIPFPWDQDGEDRPKRDRAPGFTPSAP